MATSNICTFSWIISLFFLTAYASFEFEQEILTSKYPCPCSDPKLCEPIQTGYRKEIWGFGGTKKGPFWKWYDWDQVTAVGFLNINTQDPEGLMCHAHSKGARVFLKAVPPARSLWRDAAQRKAWLTQLVQSALSSHADGVNFDWENALPWDSEDNQFYVHLIQETTAAFHKYIPGSQVSVDVAWSPAGVDGRWYDYRGLAAACDLLFVMAYDMQSQIWGRCIAQANSPPEMTRHGLEQYLALGIPPGKMLLGVPWYGYAYPCANSPPGDVEFCELKPTTFRNCSCSDAAGHQHSLNDLTNHDLPNATTPVKWNSMMQTPYFNYQDGAGIVNQVWFDNAESLKIKYKLARDMGLRGVGPWTFDMLYPDLEHAVVKEMWDAFSIFSGRGGNYDSNAISIH